MGTAPDTMTTVLEWPSVDVEAWLQRHVIGEPVDGEFFNWEVFAFTLAARAGDAKDKVQARMALQVYETLANNAASSISRSYRFSAMNLRARMMGELGALAGDPILDPEVVVQWVHDCTRLSLDEATRLASMDLRDLPIDTVRALRDIKNALTVLSHIEETPRVRDDVELQAWLRLRTRLP
ncbi:hypothetical protein LY474_11585 [Myxococcus stipitatus]|uniref:hypothetical protein n=1 Tax=Myxococcus stipitatus TaxID=83455 RepID=UPI001F4761AB|nr:hypothetical protein [Myxococcus stipitatus]MCE9668453.1 hypothetical protein [Myxococcus stipitatus]